MRNHLKIALGALLLAVGPAGAQDYPSRDITFVVPYGTGGSTDPISREFAQGLSEVLDVGVNVENRPGASGTLGISNVVTSAPDGYTIGLASNAPLIFQPMINADLPFKTPDDYTPIAKLVSLPYVLVVRADAPWQTLEELIADARERPNEIRASVSGVRATNDLTLQQLNKAADVQIRTVPFTGGGGEAMVALLGGRVEAYVGTGASTLGQEQAGEVRVLAVFQEDDYALFPDATSMGEAGYPATLGPTYYVVAPKDIPEDVRTRLVEASAEVVDSERYRTFAAENGYNVEVLTYEQMNEDLNGDLTTFAEILEFLGP